MSDNKQDSEKQIPSITKGKLLPLLFNNPVNPMNLLDALIDLKASTGSFNVMSFDNVNPEGVLSDNISGTDIIKTERKLKMTLTQRDDAGFFEQEVEFDKNLLSKVMMTDSCMYFLEKEGTVYVFCTKQFHHIRQIRPTMKGAFTRYLGRREPVKTESLN